MCSITDYYDVLLLACSSSKLTLDAECFLDSSIIKLRDGMSEWSRRSRRSSDFFVLPIQVRVKNCIYIQNPMFFCRYFSINVGFSLTRKKLSTYCLKNLFISILYITRTNKGDFYWLVPKTYEKSTKILSLFYSSGPQAHGNHQRIK